MSDAREALVALILERFRAAETYMDLPRQAGLLADAILAAGWIPPRSVAELVTGAAHPEDVCHRCGGPNVVRWHAPSEAWNQVEQHEGILCPQCFTSAYEALHPGTAWHVGPEVGGPCRYPLLTNEEPAAPPSVEDVARALAEVNEDTDWSEKGQVDDWRERDREGGAGDHGPSPRARARAPRLRQIVRLRRGC